MECRKASVIIFRAPREDSDAIGHVAHRLRLNRSEVSRRAVRLGLQILNHTVVPGATIHLESDAQVGKKKARAAPHSGHI